MRCTYGTAPRVTISEIGVTKCIHCHGIIERDAKIGRVSSDIGEVVADTDIILITTPADSHRELAKRLSPYLSEESCVVLNPGRTFGALEFQAVLLEEGCTGMPLIAEAQTIIYTCRKIDMVSVNLLAFKKDVLISAINPKDTQTIIDRIAGMHPIIFHSSKIDDPDLYWQCRDDPPLRTGDPQYRLD